MTQKCLLDRRLNPMSNWTHTLFKNRVANIAPESLPKHPAMILPSQDGNFATNAVAHLHPNVFHLSPSKISLVIVGTNAPHTLASVC